MNFENHIKYSVIIDRLVIKENININLKNQYIDNIVINQEQDDLSLNTIIKFSLIDEIKSIEEAKAVTHKLLEGIINEIAVTLGGFIGIPKFYEARIMFSTQKQCELESSVEVASSKKIIKKLKDQIEKSNDSNNYYFSLYRYSLNFRDEVARFMFLYSILAQLKGPSQWQIDKFIKEQEPSVIELPSEDIRKTDKKETIYTYYRNQVGHTSENSNLFKIRREISNIVDSFANITIMAIKVNGH